ncbi:sigma 54-interacting transcriptional regulator [Winogradskyella sp. 4-2091]|uniref:sigma 54-interacting transcriptional regulator n=1 Tax=Winogradskyella sp. 4-2091 TaxID=3381659 RepID=UPI003892B5FC
MAKKPQSSGIRKTATSKQTGGGGFVFEDKVSAWFISHFLADKYPFTLEIGKIKRIDYQVKVDGWLLEDLLITTEDSDGIEIKIPISSKSNIQINSEGPNNELLSDIWNEYLNIASDVFDSSKDYLCIINSKLHPKVSKGLNSLIRFSKENDAKSLHQRINQEDQAFSKELKKLYKGFYCPSDIAQTKNIDESETAKILSRILLVESDFEDAISIHENQIIEICNNCLLEPSDIAAQQLYKNLCVIRGELAPLSGFLDYQKLIKKLKDYFQLKGFTNHSSDWSKIHEISILKIESIQDKIGNKVSFSTLNELEDIHRLIQNNETVFILGKSGYGKSVLIKKYIQQRLNSSDKFIWIDAQSIQNQKLEGHFGIQHSLTDIFNKVQQSNCYLFIDGIDRFFKEAELNLIFPILSAASNSNSLWKTVFTCQIEDYEDVLDRLHTINMTLNIVDYKLKANTHRYISQIKKHFPILSDLFKHNHLAPILNNLKYLDLLAYNLTVKTSLTDDDVVGESTIIDWIWKKEIDSTGASCSRFIQDFSEKQAQKLSVSIPVSDFSISDISPLDKLKEGKIFVEIEDRLYLTHDLFGDWARYKLIRANKDNLKPFLLTKDLFSPLWCKAIRLYGIYLLENNSDASEWIKLFESLTTSEANEKIIQDLLLESIIFSSGIFSHLMALWDFFTQNEGHLFNRFLDQFLLKATLPNKNVLKLAEEIGGYSLAEASTYSRTPNHLYWGDVLSFIHLKKKDIINISRKKAATITRMWLEYTPLNFLHRKECSEIALDIANWMFEFKLNRGYVKDDVDEHIYAAFLAGINEYPDEVIELALKLCKRIKVEKSEKKQNKHSNSIRGNGSLFANAKIRDRIQWPDGPYERVDVAFEKICIDENALSFIINSFPNKAKEILLALFIEAPKEISFGYGHDYNLDVNEPRNWFPPFYTRGPFLYFLNHQPIAGVELIVSLINFATEQWTNSYRHNNVEIPKLSFIYNKESLNFVGDERVYFWFRDANGAPHSIVSALMALEKFLYDRVNSNESIAEYVNLILNKGSSVAYFGVLNSIGKYSSKLYLSELKPLLQVSNFYEWENSLDYGGHSIEGHQMIGSNFFSKSTWDLAKEWHLMPHRKTSIQSVSLSLFLNNENLQDYYISITDSWKKALTKIQSEDNDDVYLNKLISFYNHNNYKSIEHKGRFYYDYIEPEHLVEKYKNVREQLSEGNDSFNFPVKCFQELKQEKKYSLEDCEKLWEKIEAYSNIEDDNPYYRMSGKHQLVMGGAAILVLNKEIWIERNPDFLEWIVEYIVSMLKNYSLDISKMPQAETGYSWSQFTANILVMLWIPDLSNKQLKRQIGILLTKARYDTIQLLFVLLSKYLKWSDENFIEIQNLAILWSTVLYRDYNSTQVDKVSDDEEFKLEKHRDRLIKEFGDDKINKILIDWSELRLIEPKEKRRGRHYDDMTLGNKPGIDLELLQHAFSSMPKIHEANDKERKHLLNLYKQIADQLVFELGDIDENLNYQDDFPDKFHLWALENISDLVSQIKPTDTIKAEYFWKQILQYGHFASSWVIKFCFYFFLKNIENKENHNNFFKEWKLMIAYTNDCVTWSYAHGRRYRQNEIWDSLMCLSDSMTELWKTPDYLDFFKKVITEDIQLIDKKSNGQEIIYKLLLILQTKPGLHVLQQGIAIVDRYLRYRQVLDKLKVSDGFVRVDFKYEDTMAKTMCFLWENHRSTIINNVLILNGFKQIVLFLVAKQNPIGIELQSRIIMH